MDYFIRNCSKYPAQAKAHSPSGQFGSADATIHRDDADGIDLFVAGVASGGLLAMAGLCNYYLQRSSLQ